MEAGDLVEFNPKYDLEKRGGVARGYCARIEKQIGEHTIGLILEVNGETYVVTFGINRLVLHGSFLRKPILH